MKAAEHQLKIIIVETSEIVHRGLADVVKNQIPDVAIEHLFSLRELESFTPKHPIFLIITNPLLLQENLLRAADILSAFSNSQHIGLITTCNNRDFSALFSEFIYLNDHAEKISEIIKKHLQTPQKNKIQVDNLTNRETEVLRLLIKGYANKQIAAELFISIHTVVTHRKNISAKLGIKSVAGLAIYGVINNIIDMDDYLD